MRYVLVFLIALAMPAAAQEIAPRDGWAVHPLNLDFADAVTATRAAAKAEGLIVVTSASPTAAAAKRGITIPGNRVLGLFNNDFAVRMLAASGPAMIEAPVRVYVTETPDGTAQLSYKTPSFVFAPYAGTQSIAAELDAVFAAVAARVTAQ